MPNKNSSLFHYKRFESTGCREKNKGKEQRKKCTRNNEEERYLGLFFFFCQNIRRREQEWSPFELF